MCYRKYKNYWYKIIDEEDFIIWKVSDKNGDDGNTYIGDAIKLSLEEVINKIEKYEEYEEKCLDIIHKYGSLTFCKAADLYINDIYE